MRPYRQHRDDQHQGGLGVGKRRTDERPGVRGDVVLPAVAVFRHRCRRRHRRRRRRCAQTLWQGTEMSRPIGVFEIGEIKVFLPTVVPGLG